MAKEMHLSLVIMTSGNHSKWYLVNHYDSPDEEWLAIGAKSYRSFEDCAKELNKISADLLPETDVYHTADAETKFIGPLEMFAEI